MRGALDLSVAHRDRNERAPNSEVWEGRKYNLSEEAVKAMRLSVNIARWCATVLSLQNCPAAGTEGNEGARRPTRNDDLPHATAIPTTKHDYMNEGNDENEQMRYATQRTNDQTKTRVGSESIRQNHDFTSESEGNEGDDVNEGLRYATNDSKQQLDRLGMVVKPLMSCDLLLYSKPKNGISSLILRIRKIQKHTTV